MEPSPREVEQMTRRAKDQERSAQKAADVVEDAMSHMNPQRQYSEDKSQNKR